jgi:formate dehydrogenase
MTPHMSGTSLSAQARYTAGTREILECWFKHPSIREDYVISETPHNLGSLVLPTIIGATPQPL